MTVFTKPISERKKKSHLDVPLVEAEQPVAGTDVVVHVPAGNKNGRSSRSIDTEHLAVSEHRVTSATTVCLFLVGLLVMSIGVVGGIYLYQQCARKPVSEAEMQRLRGFLNGPFNSTDNRGLFGLLDSQRQTDLPEVSALDTRKSNYDIMASTNEPERRRGQFVHDFSINKTGIVDVDGKRCFVIPLDRDAVIFLPSFVLEMARKMTNKHTDVRVIVKTMKIQFPRLTDLSTLGESIARECSGMKTYSLVRANLGPVFKRSADESVVFDDATGSTLQIEIVNFKELERIEEEEIKNGRNGVI